MSSERFKRLKEIFQAALKRDPGERPSFLASACGGDASLRAEVERLLAIEGEGTGLFKAPSITRLSRKQSGAHRVGTLVGPYRIQAVISSGGMGMVYEAIQENPRRVVAVKVMKQGILSKSLLRRFTHEAQILARLRHPGIAQVIEAGTHRESGASGEEGAVEIPYIVMEYIPQALSLVDYAQEKQMAIRERLALFHKVLNAVHYGHEQGVIHRDLKPSNILVDGEGQVKIIDFGVARVTNTDIALTTMHTEAGQLIGTVQYMSPEQLKGDPKELDARSDVYALGVVLFELCCGKLPYDVRKKTVFEAARLISEVPPKKPSSLDRALKGDLETILLKSMEKEREDRYPTAEAFGEDIRRYLDGEVILARPASFAIKMWKWTKRNPVAGISLCVAFSAVLGLMGYLTVGPGSRDAPAENWAAYTDLRVPDDIPTIQEAIDAAGEGCTIHVSPGTYAEQLDFMGKAVTVRSIDGPEATIIRGNQERTVVTFNRGEGRDSVLDGFTITNGGTLEGGGGIRCAGGASPSILNNIITGNKTTYMGAGIFCTHESHPLISKNIISRNESDMKAGGIACFVNSSPKIVNNVIFGNSANYGGGIYCRQSSFPFISNNTISLNEARRHGGGIACTADSSRCSITNTIFWKNRAKKLDNEINVADKAQAPLISYCLIEGGYPGESNFDADPMLADPSGGNFHLTGQSPCINRGTYLNAPPDDLDGDARPCMGNIDIGADEFIGTHALEADRFILSAAAGDAVRFELDAREENGGAEYIFRCSLRGAFSGSPSAGEAPLQPVHRAAPDEIFSLNPGTALFFHAVNTLDAAGRGVMQMNIPITLSPESAGAVLRFIYTLNHPDRFVSNPVDITVMP